MQALLYRLRMAILANPVSARLVRTALGVLSAVRTPPLVPPGHWASPMTAPADRERADRWRSLTPPAIDLAEEKQLALARELEPLLLPEPSGPRYSAGPENTMYSGGDAALYGAMLRHLRPRRVMEIGSGYSTAIALDTAERHLGELELTCVEPFPDRLLATLRPGDSDRLTLERCLVQDLPLEAYDQLEAGDILFIDSSHVVKPGSDVVWLFLQVMPRLAPGVIVHVHDVFWPFEYPGTWLAERRDWTEDYLLHALLSGTRSWEIVLFASWLFEEHADVLPQPLRGYAPSGIWLRRLPG